MLQATLDLEHGHVGGMYVRINGRVVAFFTTSEALDWLAVTLGWTLIHRWEGGEKCATLYSPDDTMCMRFYGPHYMADALKYLTHQV